jgi:hypothetical protein
MRRAYSHRELYPELYDPAVAARIAAARTRSRKGSSSDLAGEEWRGAVGSPGYEVSSRGRVRSKDRAVTRRDGRVWRFTGQLLTPSPDSRGQLRVCFEGRTRLVHLLVLEAFVGPRPAGGRGCHRERPVTDNRLENLEWRVSQRREST